MLLNEGNYYDLEAGMAYFSVSQYKSFMKCEAAAMAEIQGGYKPVSYTHLDVYKRQINIS